MSYPTLNFGLGETIDMLRDAVHHFAQAELARARRRSTATTSSPWTCGASSATWVCWA